MLIQSQGTLNQRWIDVVSTLCACWVGLVAFVEFAYYIAKTIPVIVYDVVDSNPVSL